jgi:integrase
MPNAKNRLKLTKTQIEKLPLPPSGDYRVWDTQTEGLVVRVLTSGTKNYQVAYRQQRKQRWKTLGPVQSMTLEKARHTATAIRVEIREGVDRFTERTRRENIPTLSTVWDDYLVQHAIPKKAPRSVTEDRSLWRVHLHPAFGGKQVSAIGIAEVRRWHAAKSPTPYAANRALALLSKLLSFARQQEYLERNVCRDVQLFHEAPRAQTPDDDTIRQILAALEQETDRGAATMIKLLLYTGGRRGEALKARWNEFDLQKGSWTVPVEHLKGGRRNKFDLKRGLPEAATSFMREWRKDSANGDSSSPNDFVFPNLKDPSRPRTCVKATWDRVRKKANAPELHMHDLRHYYASKALDAGADLVQIGAALGHRSPDTTRIYARSSAAKVSAVPNLVADAILRARESQVSG